MGITIIVALMFVLMPLFVRIPHKTCKISFYQRACYYFLSYALLLFERILVFPFTMLYFRSFVCGDIKENIAGEVVVSTFTKCWTVGHIFFIVLVIISIICFYGVIFLSILMFSYNYFKSPLPWADENVFTRLSLLGQKIIISGFLVFDYNVTSQ